MVGSGGNRTKWRRDRGLSEAINHTDEEMEFLARLINQRTAWQILGKKGVKDGMGYMESSPEQHHPAENIYR